MIMRFILLILGLLALSGCSQRVSHMNICSGTGCFVDQAQHYSINIPTEFSIWTSISDGLDGPSHPYFYVPKEVANEPSKSNIEIVYPVGCKNLELDRTYGNKIFEDIKRDLSIIFGKQRLLKGEGLADETEPKCPGSFVFCSEAGQKAIAICINEKNHDEKMAKEIFSTFKWTDISEEEMNNALQQVGL